jgi:hypothetical protein
MSDEVSVHELKDRLERLHAALFYFIDDLVREWDGTGDYMTPAMRLPMSDMLHAQASEAVDLCRKLADADLNERLAPVGDPT